MFCLSDNDVILKLAACDLLDESLAALNITKSDVYVLPTAKYALARAVVPHGEVVAARVNEFLASVQIIAWEPPPDELRLFEDTLGIDQGEAVLYASTATLDDFALVTGDKASLKALAGSAECQPIVNRLAGRVICLEQIIQRCVNHAGFDTVKNKVVPARGCDKALGAIFGSGLTTNATSVHEGLSSYISHLRSATGNLLMP